jgi:uncharacterized membrane protein YfcA
MLMLETIVDPAVVPPDNLVMFTVLAVVAFATSVFSAIVGMGGGIILLACLLLFLDPIAAIPIHGVIQLVSNSSRAYVQRKHLAWPLIWRYSILLLPFGLIAIQFVVQVPQDLLKGFIGVFVLLATWRPNWLLLGTRPEKVDVRRRFILLGGVVGFLNILVGAVGPFIAPFFLNMGFSRQAIVGTKAACQSFGHVVKVILFGIAGFAFMGYLPLVALLIPLVLLGTWGGSRLLEKVSEVSVVWLFKTVLTLVGCWLILSKFILSA